MKYDELRPIVESDPARLLDRLGVRMERGRAWCPFCQSDGRPHQTPDFGIRPDGKGWKCHRCGVIGDWVRLVRLMLKCGFAGAVKFIAGAYGVTEWSGGAVIAPERREPIVAAERERKAYRTAEDAIAACQAMLSRQRGGVWNVVGVWNYTDALIQVRYQRMGDKEYRPIHRTKRGWVIGAPKKPWPLYGIAEALK